VTTLTIAAQDSTTMLRRELKHTLRFPLLLVGVSSPAWDQLTEIAKQRQAGR
jgi:hypothetical protein